MQKMNECKLITCLLPQQIALKVMEKLSDEKGIIMANKSQARGSSFMNHLTWIEMEVLEVVVASHQADEIYDYLFEISEMNMPHGGLIFQHALSRTSSYALPKT